MIINSFFKFRSRFKNQIFWKAAGKIIFIAAACFIIWRSIDVQTMMMLVDKLSISMFGIAVMVCIMDKIIMGFKWNYLLRLFDVHVSVYIPIIANLRAKVFHFFTPTTLGEDVYKTYYLKQCGAELAPTVSSIFVERVIGILSSFAIICLLLYVPFHYLQMDHSVWIGIAGAVGFISITTILALMIKYSDRMMYFPMWKWLPRKMQHYYGRLSGIVALIQSGKQNIWYFYFLSIIEKIAYGSVIYFSAKAIGVQGLNYFYFISATPLLALLERLPVTVSAIGVREGLIVVLMKPYFVEPTAPIMIALVFRAAELMMTIICLFVWFIPHDAVKFDTRIQQMKNDMDQLDSDKIDTRFQKG